MNKFIGAIVVVVLIVIAVSYFQNNKQPIHNRQSVEITTNPGTEVFAKLPDGERQFLSNVPKFDNRELDRIKANVPINADVVLRYNNIEKVIAYEEWQEANAISVDFNALMPIEINAFPYASVFIKLPSSDEFIKPRRQDFRADPPPNTNVTPIRRGLQVPIGTTIKLVYQAQEKIFTYEEWKKDKYISHKFLKP